MPPLLVSIVFAAVSVFSLDTLVGLLVAIRFVTFTVGFGVGLFVGLGGGTVGEVDVGLCVAGEGLLMASYNAVEYSDRHATTEKHPSPLSQTLFNK